MKKALIIVCMLSSICILFSTKSYAVNSSVTKTEVKEKESNKKESKQLNKIFKRIRKVKARIEKKT